MTSSQKREYVADRCCVMERGLQSMRDSEKGHGCYPTSLNDINKQDVGHNEEKERGPKRRAVVQDIYYKEQEQDRWRDMLSQISTL